MTIRTILSRAVIVSAVVASLSLSGCATQSTEYDPTVAEQLQTQVLAVSTSSAATDYAGALVTLNELAVGLKDALARDQLTEARYESVLAAIALVRLDLQATIDAQTPVEPPPSDDDENGKDPGKGRGKDQD